MSVLLYVGIINILCMYHIKYYVMFGYMHCVCDMLFHTSMWRYVMLHI